MNTETLMDQAVVLVAWVLAAIIFWRCVNVLRGMYFGHRKCSGVRFLAFGLSYVVLAVTSIGSAIVIMHGTYTLSHFGFLAASSGMILFDRRYRQGKAGAC